MTSYPFLKVVAATAKYYFRFRISWRHYLQKGKVYQQTNILSTYLYSVLRYNYFRFLKTNVAILEFYFRFQSDHFAVIGMLFYIRLPNFVQIGTSATEIWRHIDFKDGGRQPCCICFDAMADHSRSAFRCLNSVLKSLVRHINIVPKILRCIDFGVLAWNCPFTPLLGDFGAYFPHMTSPIAPTPKRTVLGGNTPFSVRIGATVRPGRVMKKKTQDNKEVTKVLYFPYLGGNPHWTDLTQKLHSGWCPRRNHVCQVSNWYLHALRFYRGSNFRFSYWFLHGSTIVQR